MTTTTDAPDVLVVGPRGDGPAARTRELWKYRRTLPFFGKTLIEKRYLRTWLGWIWIPLRPVLDVATRALVFGGLLAAPSNGVPYLLFFLVGRGTWQFFAGTLFWMTRSIELNRKFLRRLYLPRLILLFSATAVSLLDYLIYLALTALIVVFYLITDGTTYLHLSPQLLFWPLGLLLCFLLAVSIGLWLSVLGAQARDVRFTLGIALGFWFYVTPVIYPLSNVPEGWQLAASLNPMTAPVELVKLGVFDRGEVPIEAVASCLGAIALIGGLGLRFFFRSETAALDSI